MSQPYLFEVETPRRTARAPRTGAAPTSVGASVGAAPTKRKKRRPKPQVSANIKPTVVRHAGTWTITFPAPAPMSSVNSGNQHWRRTSPIHKTWRQTMYQYARYAKLPVGLTRVRIDFVLRFPRAGRQDVGNYYTHVVKPCVDGLGPERERTIQKGARAGTVERSVGYGLIPDDTAEYLDGPYLLLGEPVRDRAMPFGQVVVTVTDLSGVAA